MDEFLKDVLDLRFDEVVSDCNYLAGSSILFHRGLRATKLYSEAAKETRGVSLHAKESRCVLTSKGT
jgi:hypothetical protein